VLNCSVGLLVMVLLLAVAGRILDRRWLMKIMRREWLRKG